jgi:hypothetical protein
VRKATENLSQDSWSRSSNQASPKYELEHSPIYLLNQLLSLMALEYMDDFQIKRLWPSGVVSWEKYNLDVGEKCGVLQVSSTLINEKQDFAIFSIQFCILLSEVIFKYFGGHPRIYISFIFCGQSRDILEAMWSFIFSNYKRWQLITIIRIACEKHSNLLFRFCATVTKISLKSECFARL